MNIALVIAGGVGARMGGDVPKQFLYINGKYVIVYTLEAFQKNPEIDAIGLVCVDGWIDTVWECAKQYGITKLEFIVDGGRNGQESILKGLTEAKKRYSDEDIILVHDGVRPMVTQRIITDCIADTKEYGNAITCVPCQEAMLVTEDGVTSSQSYPRSRLKRTQTPQCFYIGDLWNLHQEAIAEGNTNSVSSCTLMVEMGRSVHMTLGSEKNIKLTTPDDLDIFETFLAVKNSK